MPGLAHPTTDAGCDRLPVVIDAAGPDARVMDARRALTLQVEWGADEALDVAPLRRLRDPGSPARSDEPDPASGRVSVDEGARLRRRAAVEPPSVGPFATLAAWSSALEVFEGAGLAATATHLVRPEGADRLRPGSLLIIGEAPGEEEDRSGRPFVGPEGRLVRRMLGSIGVDPAETIWAYLAPWRPPGGRAPSETEIAACLPFLRELARLVRPRLVLALGSLPAKALIGPSARRGRWGEARLAEPDLIVPVLATVNPAVLLKQPQQKAQAWSDVRLLRRRMDEVTGS